MPTVVHPLRTLTAVCALASVGLSLAGCQSGDTPAAPTTSSTQSESGQTPSGQGSDEQSSAPSTPSETSSTSASATSAAPTGQGDADATATGGQSKLTFSLPAGFKVFDHEELQNDSDLAELSSITGVPAAQLRLPTPLMDLNAVSMEKESGGTTSILLFGGGAAESVPDLAQAKQIIAKTGSQYVGYGTAKTSLGQAALVESTDPAANGGTVTHIDMYLPEHAGTSGQVTINTMTSARAHEIAELVASTIKAS